jgi:hypothetical protein
MTFDFKKNYLRATYLLDLMKYRYKKKEKYKHTNKNKPNKIVTAISFKAIRE